MKNWKSKTTKVTVSFLLEKERQRFRQEKRDRPGRSILIHEFIDRVDNHRIAMAKIEFPYLAKVEQDRRTYLERRLGGRFPVFHGSASTQKLLSDKHISESPNVVQISDIRQMGNPTFVNPEQGAP